MNRLGSTDRIKDVWERLRTIPGNLAAYWSGKLAGWRQSAALAHEAATPAATKAEINRLRQAMAIFAKTSPQLSAPPKLTAEENAIAQSIREETTRLNRNNATRTAAYWKLFERRPELHWALLAHMVSRNGGWNMTDLKGELLPRLLSPARAEAIFAFLERANALIFQDAYPQLRLYEYSVERRQPHFHLLPAFGVSAFMRPVWEQFWRERGSALLTVALIVNEQHYIERRVVRDERFRRSVLDTTAFHALSLLQLNAIVLPYAPKAEPENGTGTAAANPDYRLAGLILENFSELEERIEFGKQLYAILFGVPDIAAGARAFAAARPHSGSRADYWPGLFAPLNKDAQQAKYAEKLDGGKLLPGAAPLYSPKLEQAWPDVAFAPPERFDWYEGGSGPFRFLTKPRLPASFDMTNEYAFALNKLELAVLAGELLFD